MVELRTIHQVRFVTDNAGRIAFDLPELMGQETWFAVTSDGYEVPADGFGRRGVRLTPKPGETLTIEVNRTSIAKRLGRVTGAGLFGESQKLGLETDWKESRRARLRQRAERGAQWPHVLGVGRYECRPLSARHLRHVERDDGDSAARELRAAAAIEVRLLHRRRRPAARRREDAGRRADLAERLRELARQDRASSGWWRRT